MLRQQEDTVLGAAQTQAIKVAYTRKHMTEVNMTLNCLPKGLKYESSMGVT